MVLAPPVLRFDNSPGAMFMAADGLHFPCLLGLSGRGPVVVLASADFVSWTPILTNPPVLGQLNPVDQAATNLTQRFYRALGIRDRGGESALCFAFVEFHGYWRIVPGHLDGTAR